MAASGLRVQSLLRVCWLDQLPQRCIRLICLYLQASSVLPAAVLYSLAVGAQVPRRAGIPTPACIAV